jgi:TonB family protein
MLTRHIAGAALLSVCVVLLEAWPLAAQTGFEPATFKSGHPPQLPQLGVGGGEVSLEVVVDATGRVGTIKPLRSTAGFTQPLTDAVRSWQFAPADDSQEAADGTKTLVPMSSKVLVVGMFHAPAMMGPTLGEPIKDIGIPSADAPKVLSSVTASFPPTAFTGGAVLAEVTVDTNGRARTRVVISGSAPFDSAALDALKAWTFAPGRVSGRTVSSRIYVVFVFPLPVINSIGK